MPKTGLSIFFSYSRSDAEFAQKLAKDLQAEGYSIWIDQISVEPGTRWDSEVEKALESSDVFLVVLSPDAVSSENVMDEFAFALEENKKIVPVLHRDCKIPLRLRRLHYIDFTGDYVAGLAQLKKSLRSENGLEDMEQEFISSSKKGLQNQSRSLKYILAPVLLIIFSVGIYLVIKREPDPIPEIRVNENGQGTGINIPTGTWEGPTRSNLGTPYTTKLNISSSRYTVETSGTTDDCVANMELQNRGESSITFRYQLSESRRGQCFPSGTVTLSNIGDSSLRYLWYSDNQLIQVSGDLNRE
ncbi:MAG: toll/interleukin-1 receptor domain-containing protein [Thermodesulfobacteriota bacterium]